MDCLVLPVSMLKRRYSGSRLRYRSLSDNAFSDDDSVTVVVGREKREFVVNPFVLEESPFRVLIEMARKEKKGMRRDSNGDKRVILGDVDSILFEHMLWLMHNDCSSLFQLNLKEIIDFYAQDV